MTEPGLSTGQVLAVLELVGEANGAGDIGELRALILPALQRVVPADFVSYNEVRADDGAPFVMVVPEAPPELFAVWPEVAGENPLIANYERTRDGRARRFSDLVTPDELHALRVYRDFYAVLGVEHQIAFTLAAPRGVTVGLALSRTAASGDFGDDERAMLDLARPHLVQAFRNAQRGPGPLDGATLAAAGLTEREADVLRSFAAGRSGRETAAALGMSPATVRTHSVAIHRKLGVRTRAQAVAAARELRRTT